MVILRTPGVFWEVYRLGLFAPGHSYSNFGQKNTCDLVNREYSCAGECFPNFWGYLYCTVQYSTNSIKDASNTLQVIIISISVSVIFHPEIFIILVLTRSSFCEAGILIPCISIGGFPVVKLLMWGPYGISSTPTSTCTSI
ncbi:hypothetical protein HOY80DRAFT_704995 [Tuber brumale]|nr:hypothetical protein HOY80DRAFT_704995 [Tuber brumale]